MDNAGDTGKNEDWSLERAANRVTIMAAPLSVLVLRIVRSAVWGGAAGFSLYQAFESERLWRYVPGAPQQASIAALALVWIITAYVLARAIDRVIDGVIDGRLNAARFRAARGGR